jgi:hypothetical protein
MLLKQQQLPFEAMMPALPVPIPVALVVTTTLTAAAAAAMVPHLTETTVTTATLIAPWSAGGSPLH